ncbi:hypothetical protein GCM10010510_13270 [Streptomyces anandii JCM 4720]|nr:hypothetical protein GCM10010510_13270 [Streptomyces anandii JCM 4720]
MAEYAGIFCRHTGQQILEPQILDSTAFERAYGVTPTPLAGTADTRLAWYGEWLASR